MKLIIAGLAALAVAAPAVVFAADAPAAAAPAAVAKPSVETTTIGELVDNPKAKAVLEKDYPVLLALTLIGAVLTVLGNLLADIALTIADPRVRLHPTAGRPSHGAPV